MKVGILGSGEVAKSLATGFARHGHQVQIGTRDPAKLAEWAATQRSVAIGTFTMAAGFGQLIVLAVKGTAALLHHNPRVTVNESARHHG